MRDKLKDKKHFDTFIEEELDDISYYTQKLEKNEVREDRIYAVKKQIYIAKYQIFYSNYSIGIEISNIKSELISLLNDLDKYWNSNSGYVGIVWMLSIGIMLEIEETEFNKLVQLVEKDNPNDFLIDFLINSKNENWTINSTEFQFEKPYKSLKEVINLSKTDKQKAVERLKKYLDKEWYKGHSDTGWYDSHKSKHNTYSGYWCWESGALVKILGLDDTILKEQQYYPYDMVHFK